MSPGLSELGEVLRGRHRGEAQRLLDEAEVTAADVALMPLLSRCVETRARWEGQ